MSARDELAEVIANFRDDWYKVARKSPAGIDRDAADAILAAGYSKPRTIPEEYLSQQSDGSYLTDHKAGTIIESADGSVWRFDEGDWDCLDWRSAKLSGPATVLYTPKES